MTAHDYIVRASAAKGSIRAFAAETTRMTEYARQIHNTSPVATAALGRCLTAGAMMGVGMKGEKDLLTIRIAGDGPLKGITVTANAKGFVKGFVDEPLVLIPANAKGKLDVGGAIGRGSLSVIKDLGMKEPYTGRVDLQSGEIADDLTWYFAVSEQIPSSVALGVLMQQDNHVKAAGGFLIQLMPFAEEAHIAALEETLQSLPSVTSLLEQGLTPEDILQKILGDMDLEILEKTETGFHCDCSAARIERALLSLGKTQLESLMDEEKPVEVKCHFCGRQYQFSKTDLLRLIREGTTAEK